MKHPALLLLTLFLLLHRTGFAGPNLVAEVRTLVDSGKTAAARELLQKQRNVSGLSPLLLEAMSWLGRGELTRKQYDEAEHDAMETYALVGEVLKGRPLDAEPRLPIALGAAIEVQAQVLAARGEADKAVALLKTELSKYEKTSIGLRLQKNLNLLTLEGKPAPELKFERYLGPKPQSLASLRGKPVLLFMWAHWCGDCKAQGPVIAKLRSEFSAKGLQVIAPTQTYGSAAGGATATPAAEIPYIDEVRRRAYASLIDVPAPVSNATFFTYGTSTVPTLVLIDTQGKVAMYHPGRMTYEELRPRIEALFSQKSAAPAKTKN